MTMSKPLVITAVVLLGALVAVAAWLIGPFLTDEPGIRVKNGSVYIETVSGAGFDQKGDDFESKKSAKSCLTVKVATTKSCRGPNPLSGVRSVEFGTIDDPSELHQVATSGGKFKARLKKVWKFDPPSDHTKVHHPNTIVSLIRMSAGVPGGATLECEMGSDKNDDWILISNGC